jgi:hypothetical protein
MAGFHRTLPQPHIDGIGETELTFDGDHPEDRIDAVKKREVPDMDHQRMRD